MPAPRACESPPGAFAYRMCEPTGCCPMTPPACSLRPLLPAVLLLCALVLGLAAPAAAQRTPKPLALPDTAGAGPVFVVPLEGLVENSLARYVARALADAEAAGARAVVFHIDTFGGLVDAADRIRKSILDAPLPTVAFIDKNAASAGALIAYAADRIVMVPGASIGAATVVEGGSGEAAPDKYQSYMRGLMRSTAEANGRDPRIAEAMVDETLEVPGVSPAGQVLTLSAQEALRLGVADAILGDVPAVQAALGAAGAARVDHHASWAEQVLRFLSSPVLQSILMLMMLGGLYFELQTPGVGFAGAMALAGAAFFFAPHYLLGLVESWEIVLFGIGVLLLLAEIFVLPGFGVAGVSGLVLITGSLLAALVGNVGLRFPPFEALTGAIGTMAVTFVLLFVLIFSLARYLPRSGRFNQLVLGTELAGVQGYTSADEVPALVGKVGTTLTPLRPAGAADIEGARVDVVTAGEYVAVGTAVQVVRVRGSRVEVRPVQALAAAAPPAAT